MHETYVTIHGNVSKITRTGVTAQGDTYHTIRVASSPRFRTPDGWQDGATSFYSVTCWGALAEHVATCVRVGDPVVVHGRLELREWSTGDKSGREAELRATSVGHDLARGTSLFRRSERRTAAGAPAPAAEEAVARAGEELRAADAAGVLERQEADAA